MSLILGFDTATPTASVALFDKEKGEVIGRADEPVRTHGKALMMLIDEVMEASGAARRDLAAVACGLGPGSFTGLRVGLTTAKALCFVLDIPLLGVSSLRALAGRIAGESACGNHSSEEPVEDVLLPCLDARRGELYLAAYRSNLSAAPSRGAERWKPWIGPLALAPVDVGETLKQAASQWSAHKQAGRSKSIRFRALGTGLELVGKRWSQVRDLLGPGADLEICDDTDSWPDAGFLVRQAALLLDEGSVLDLDGAQPIYLRPSDAEENFGLDLSPKP